MDPLLERHFLTRILEQTTFFGFALEDMRDGLSTVDRTRSENEERFWFVRRIRKLFSRDSF